MGDWQGDIKPLRADLDGFCRLRVGGYRIVYRVMRPNTIRLGYADTRDIVYETFRQLRILGEINV